MDEVQKLKELVRDMYEVNRKLAWHDSLSHNCDYGLAKSAEFEQRMTELGIEVDWA